MVIMPSLTSIAIMRNIQDPSHWSRTISLLGNVFKRRLPRHSGEVRLENLVTGLDKAFEGGATWARA